MSADAFVSARDFLLAHRTDHDTAVRDFRWPSLDRFNWALDYFDGLARDSSALALRIVDDDGTEHRRTYAEMTAASNRTANFLRRAGVRRGDRVLLMVGNEVALWDTLLAAMKLGAVVVPATSLLTADDLRDRLTRGAIGHVVVGAAHAERFADLDGAFTRIAVGGDAPGWMRLEEATAASAEFTPDGVTRATDPLLLYFTSGTTSKPKLVLHSHQSYPVGHLSTMYWLGLRPGDLHWNISSPGWAKHAWSCVYAPWNAGATVFISNYARFHAEAILDRLVQAKVTTLCAPPTVWRMLIQAPLERYAVTLREVASAGEPLNPEVIERVRAAWGLTIRDGFGQTETTALVGNPPGQRVVAGSMGRPLPGYRITLRDQDGALATEGQICVELDGGAMGVMRGYADDDEKTRDVMREGRYHTGDVAMRDEHGYITYVGRADDVFKASDYRISPFELESALIEHPAVAEAAVVPSPDPVRHAVPKAFVFLAPGHVPSRQLAGDILAFARETLAPYKRIRRLEFSDLPKTISGKIRRVQLKAIEEARRATGGRAEHEYFEEDFS